MNKIAAVCLIAVVLLASCTNWKETADSWMTEADKQRTRAESAEEHAAELQKELDKAQESLDSVQDERDQLMANLQEFGDRIDSFRQDLERLQSRMERAEATVASYQPFMECEAISGTIEYWDLTTISDSLRTIVKKAFSADRIIGAYGERVWSNTDVRYYTLSWPAEPEQNFDYYSAKFIVWPTNDKGNARGVFSLDDQCWVDLDLE